MVVIHLAGPVGFDPTTTGFGGLCTLFLLEKVVQHPVLTRRRALANSTLDLIYERLELQEITLRLTYGKQEIEEGEEQADPEAYQNRVDESD